MSKSRQNSNTPNRLSVADRTELLTKTGTREGEVILQRDIGLLYAWTDTQGTDNGGTVLNVGAGSWLAQFSGAVNVKWFGAKGDGDEYSIVQAAIKAAYEENATDLIFEPNTQISISQAIFFNSYGVLDRSLNVFNLNVLLTQATAGGAAVNIGRGADVGNADTIERTGKIIFHTPQIDGGSIAGENGFGIARAEDVVILNPIILNCKRDYVGTREGGRAITVHGRCNSVSVVNHRAYNCSDAFHVGHVPDYTPDDIKITPIIAITLGNPTTLTLSDNQFSVGEMAYTYQIGGTIELNPTYSNKAEYEVLSSSGSDITIDVDSTAFGAFTSGGTILLADLTLGGRSPSVSVVGMYAEDCEYSLINIEAANQPRIITPLQTVFFSNVTSKNCGTISTRGLINGNNACGLQVNGLIVYNDADNAIESIVRGSFQGAKIEGVFDIHTLKKSIIDATPTEENPVGSGIDAGYSVHPYGTSLDNTYDLNVIYRGNTSTIESAIYVTDFGGTSIDLFYRNLINISFSGLADGDAYDRDLNNIALHHTNEIEFNDKTNSSSYVGSLTTANTLSSAPSELNGIADVIKIIDNGAGSSLLDFQNTSKSSKGKLQYLYSNDRFYMSLAGAQTYQFTANNIQPSADNLRDLGSAGLRMRTIYAGTGTINTSDEREKQQQALLTTAEKNVAISLKGSIKTFKFNDAVKAKGDGARIHVGVMAQEVISIFSAHGLDATKYALLCYDEWEQELDDEGNVTLEAGNRYGIRYEELLAFIISAM